MKVRMVMVFNMYVNLLLQWLCKPFAYAEEFISHQSYDFQIRGTNRVSNTMQKTQLSLINPE